MHGVIVMCPSTAAPLHFTSPLLSHLGGSAALDPVHIFIMSQHQHFRLKIQSERSHFFRKAGLYIKGIKVLDGTEVQREAEFKADEGRKLQTADER